MTDIPITFVTGNPRKRRKCYEDKWLALCAFSLFAKVPEVSRLLSRARRRFVTFFERYSRFSPSSNAARRQGRIVAPRGPTNFGWDPIFAPDEYAHLGLTYEPVTSLFLFVANIFSNDRFAEMTDEQKNSVSHRQRALSKLKDHLISNHLLKTIQE